MLTPEKTLSLYPELDSIQGELRALIIEAMQRYKYKSNYKRQPIPENIDLMETIAHHVCRHFWLNMDELKGRCREREMVDARAVFVGVCREKGILVKHAAKYLGRDRTTGTHIIKNVVSVKEVAAHIPKVIKLLDA